MTDAPTRRMPGTLVADERPPRPHSPVVPDDEVDLDSVGDLEWATAAQLDTTDEVMFRRFPEVDYRSGTGGVLCWHVPTLREWWGFTDADRYAHLMPPEDKP